VFSQYGQLIFGVGELVPAQVQHFQFMKTLKKSSYRCVDLMQTETTMTNQNRQIKVDLTKVQVQGLKASVLSFALLNST